MQCNIPIPDLPARLDHTVCLYKDYPYLVRTDGSSSDKIYLYDMVFQDKLMHTIRSNDPALDVATPPLGYTQQSPERVCYFSRRPHRRFKQGITPDSVYYHYEKQDFYVNFYTQGTADAMAKNYPPLKTLTSSLCRSNNEGKYIELAVSNDVALVLNETGVIYVYFRKVRVAESTRTMIKHHQIKIIKSPKEWVIRRYLSEYDFDIVN